MAGQQTVSRQEVTSRLQRYDITKNRQLTPLSSPDLYPHTRRCAVLVPLFLHPRDQQWHVLLTKRASTLRTHASLVALPGGRQDPTDEDDVHTALREAEEEVGLPPSDVTVAARLPPFFTRDNNSVFPVVGFIPDHFRPTPNPHEVALVFSVPLKKFVEVTYREFVVRGTRFASPFFEHVVHDTTILIWGVTCSMCVAVARAVFGPFKRFRIELTDGDSEKEKGDQAVDNVDDDDVFGDVVVLYHKLCQMTRPGASRL